MDNGGKVDAAAPEPKLNIPQKKTPPPEPQLNIPKISNEEYFVARVLYSETSSIGTFEEKIAICCVIQNRIKNKAFGGGKLLTAYDVCKQPKAFSCVNSSTNINWSEFKPNLNQWTKISCMLAKALMKRGKNQFTNYNWTKEIVYYHDKSIKKPSGWDNRYWKAILVKETKNFKFYKIVPNRPKIKKRGRR